MKTRFVQGRSAFLLKVLLALLAAFLLNCKLPAYAASEISGRVVSVADGDTLTLLHGRESVRVRLTEIDAPERGQAFGKRSTQSLRALCAQAQARVGVAGTDLYGRTLGRVWCQGLDANAEQVRRGMAWVYDQYVTDASLYAVQEAARQNKLGLWSDARPIQPWLWRRGVRSNAQDQALQPIETRVERPVMGNRRSRIYHLPVGCPSYDKVAPKNQLLFDSEQAARQAGYRRAGNCR